MNGREAFLFHDHQAGHYLSLKILTANAEACNNAGIYYYLPTLLHMTKQNTKTDKALKLVQKHGMIRVRDAIAQGIHPEYLRRLCDTPRDFQYS